MSRIESQKVPGSVVLWMAIDANSWIARPERGGLRDVTRLAASRDRTRNTETTSWMDESCLLNELAVAESWLGARKVRRRVDVDG